MGKAQNSGLAHCCHHDKHWEFCFDFDERVEYIKTRKPKDERELRLRLFQLIPDDQLPGWESLERGALNKAWGALNKAWDAYTKAGAALSKAGDAYNKAKAAYNKARDAYTKAGAAYYKAKAADNKALAAYNKALAADNKALAAYNKAWDAYIAKYKPELDLLHDRLFPDCPFDGKTIFGGGKG